ncbi:PTS sugar transporter subunit IIB [bacterium]|nr:PTS sugar transporter subunit IIB [bacterium]
MKDFFNDFQMPIMSQSVKFIRVDDRLIHGQVIVGWLPFLKVNHVFVVNERVAADSIRQEMMLMSVPSHVSLQFKDPQGLVDSPKLPSESMVLVSSPKDAWHCFNAGLMSETLNIGGMHARPGKQEVFEALHLDEEDRDYLRNLVKNGIHLVFQPTPQNDPVSLNDIL